jgi:adenine phosphoribosyltransferase
MEIKMSKDSCNLLNFLTCVPDFPTQGIMFRDISPMIANPYAFQYAINQFEALTDDLDFSHILAIESRGFIFGSALAMHLAKPLVLARRPNKLPLVAYSQSYKLEYGEGTLQIQGNRLNSDSKVLIIDDVIATGGTLLAGANLVAKAGARLAGVVTLLEIKYLNGNSRLQEKNIIARSILSA